MEYGICEYYDELKNFGTHKKVTLNYYDEMDESVWKNYHMTYLAVMFVENPNGEQETIYGPICRLSF